MHPQKVDDHGLAGPGAKDCRGVADVVAVLNIMYNNADHVIDHTKLAFYRNPVEMRTASEIPRGDLVLLPLTDFNRIKAVEKVDKTPKFHAKCVLEDKTFIIFAPAFDTKKWEGILSPFFWVSETENEDEVNMACGEFRRPAREDGLQAHLLEK